MQYNDVTIDGSVGGVVADVPLELNGGASTTSPILLATTSNIASGIGLEIESINTSGTIADNGSQWAGPYPGVLSGIESSALRSHFYFNRGKDIQIKLSGLDDGETYNLLIYGGHDQIGDTTNSIVTGVGVTGSGADFTNKTMNTWTNSTEVIQWSDIAPDSGVIAFNLEGNREAWLNFMSIEQVTVVPEPESIAIWSLFGLGLTCFGVYRRRKK